MSFHDDNPTIRQTEKAVFTNMLMIEDGEGNVVVQRRVKGWNGLAFPGGHLNPMETVTESITREIKEETGLVVSSLRICGIKQWFNKEEGRNVCFLFKTTDWSGSLERSSEGDVFWMPLADLAASNELAHGFVDMLKVFLDDSINEMYYPDDGDSAAILL